MKKLIKYANQLFCLSLLLLGMSLIASKTIFAPMAGIAVIGMAFIYAAWYFSKNLKKKKSQADDYFF
ncbi:MAG: hypothetical protein AAGD28_08715 [Bacteroidota bacterium]